MRTIKIEVKTHYNIRFDFHDFTKIFTKAKTDLWAEATHAFAEFDLDDTTIGNLQKCYESLGRHMNDQAAKDLKYIVNCLGFDGIDNYGGFFKKTDKGFGEYHIAVYNNGADL